MSVWLAIPSARPNGGTIPLWRERGYKVAACFDEGGGGGIEVDIRESILPYPGYSMAVNQLVRLVMEQDSAAQFFVIGGDDTLPDPTHAPDQIARQCKEHFHALACNRGEQRSCEHFSETFGVMQPTGDRFAGGSIDRIAGSAWMGREWCLRANQGKGPLWPEFAHMFVDEALMCVAEKLGVYWRRPDLIHFHDHFMRQSAALDSPAVGKPIPDHLKQWNTQKHWNESKAIFERLKAQNFAPCMPLLAEVCA